MALADIVQKTKNQSSLYSSRGQAMVEYVLILIVTVSILLALVYQVFKPFQSFVKSYMGDYTACLLETGELPSLGNSDAAAALSDEGCDSKFDSATLGSGRPPSSRDGKNGEKGSSAEKGNSDSSSDGDGSGGTTAGGSGRSSSSGNNLLLQSMKTKTGTETGEGPSDKVTEIPLSQSSRFYNRRDSYSKDSTATVGGQPYKAILGLSEDEKKKQEKQEGNKRTVASGESLSPPPKKTRIKPPPPKEFVEAEESPLTFGNFFRFLLIAAIVIAIVVVLGGQILKFSKSREK